jgi:predicted PurR-regulated permease PerM
MNQTDPGAGTPGDAATPARLAPSTPVTLLLIVLLAVTGGAAIVLLTFAHQLWAGLACAVVAAAALWGADRRLRRRVEVRRNAAADHG